MIRYRILPEHRLMVLCFWGSISEEEIVALTEALTKEPDYSRDYDALVDNTGLDHTLSSRELRQLIQREIPQLNADSRMAVVSPADVTYGVSRMHQMLTEYRAPFHIEVFRDRKSALDWLGRGDLDLEHVCEELERSA